jgi:predicted homoserine dehydrogenase-like protein
MTKKQFWSGFANIWPDSDPPMNLSISSTSAARPAKPVRVALIGAGKFGSMFLSQVPHTPGLEVPVIVDLDRDARARPAAPSAGMTRGSATAFTDDGARAMRRRDGCVVEATGNPAVGISHARAAIAPASTS